jgi:proteasome lid subunit RPN8/RPN11
MDRRVATTLLVDRAVRDAIVEHARDGAPEEVCGVLGGVRGAGGTDGSDEPDSSGGDEDSGPDAPRSARARTAHRVPNVASAPRTRYELDPSEQFRAMEAIEDAGDDVVGFYHSHPRGPPAPSATDEALATWSGYSYVIVSLDGPEPELGSWRWTGETFERGAVEVVEEE